MNTLRSTGSLSFGALAGNSNSINVFKNNIDGSTATNARFSLSAICTYMQSNSAAYNISLPNMNYGPVYALSEYRGATYSTLYTTYSANNKYVGEATGTVTLARTYVLSSFGVFRYLLVGGGGYSFNCQNGNQTISMNLSVRWPNGNLSAYNETPARGTYKMIAIKNAFSNFKIAFVSSTPLDKQSYQRTNIIGNLIKNGSYRNTSSTGSLDFDASTVVGSFSSVSAVYLNYTVVQPKTGECYGGMSCGTDEVFYY